MSDKPRPVNIALSQLSGEQPQCISIEGATRFCKTNQL